MKKASFMAGALALVFTLTGAITSSVRAQTIVPPPNSDPFYVPPAGYASLPNGMILSDRTINAEYLLPFLSTNVTNQLGSAGAALLPAISTLQNLKINAYQVLYKSTDSNNQPVAEVVTILVPQETWSGSGTRPLVAFESAEDSVSNICEPSYTLRAGLLGQPASQASGSQLDMLLGLIPLTEGYAVAIADYEGPQSEWLAGAQAGHAVLDGIRAALHYAPDGLSSTTPVGLSGYSGGGGAGGGAAALRQVYAPELNIVGATVGAASNSDLSVVYKANDGTLEEGILPQAVVGLSRAYPNAGVAQYFNAAGNQLLAAAANQNQCLITQAITFAFDGPLENYTINPSVNLVNSPPGGILFPVNSLVDQPLVPDMPILNYNDEFDGFVPVTGDNEVALKYCKAGANVEVMRTSTPLPFSNGTPVGVVVHGIAAIEGALPALHYLTNRFKGLPPRNDCPYSVLWSVNDGMPYQALNTQ